MRWYKKTITHFFTLGFLGSAGWASADPIPDDSPLKKANYLSSRPFATARGDALQGTLTGWADGLDAFYDNPAGIGGLDEKAQPPGLSEFAVPYLGYAENANSQKFLPQLETAHSARDPILTKEILTSATDQPLYGRISFVPHAIYKKLLLGYMVDSQAVAVARSDSKIDVQQQTDQGPIVGFSGEGNRGLVRLGLSAAFISRNVSAAQVDYNDLLESDRRKTALKENSETYHGQRYNLGLNITPNWKNLPLSFAVSGKDLGTTKLKTEHENQDTLDIPERVDLSTQLSFHLIDEVVLRWGFSANEVSANWKTPSDKFATGLELDVGHRPGGLSGLSLTTSYTTAGAAFGAHVTMSVISLEYADYPYRLKGSEESLIERRHAGILSLNVAEK